jgi:deoxyhypusine synthase
MEIEAGMGVEALVDGMEHCGFGARRLAESVKIYEEMLSGEYTKFFALSGAMVPAGLRNVVSDLIRNGHINVLVTTGANLVHDIIESFGFHCLGTPESDDAALRAEGVSRIYDVFLRDEDFIQFEELMQSILPDTAQTISGTELMKHLGSQISDNRSILRSAYDLGVPICPALSDQ